MITLLVTNFVALCSNLKAKYVKRFQEKHAIKKSRLSEEFHANHSQANQKQNKIKTEKQPPITINRNKTVLLPYKNFPLDLSRKLSVLRQYLNNFSMFVKQYCFYGGFCCVSIFWRIQYDCTATKCFSFHFLLSFFFSQKVPMTCDS